ncbi:MAG: ferredoxin family protein [Paucimonas sp.]|jgi:ferredoxin|uniref:ferredoxin FdxA n=1 Tax=Pantoea sp. Cy-639 TaxID=2608360 RepID=UPI00141FBC88|nr:ferredoxin FdxA [Pantoea sp. Cy-639]MDR2307976.1 ferredoxin family protein [Paucimonas sp.]NIF16601.1 ferredoxin family protein [Pantoea sp. Cy-639]
MTYVVTDNCIQCRHTNCVDICPADAFHLGPNFIVINPAECVDCALCVPECPEAAISSEHELPDSERHFIALNAELAQTWPVLLQRIDPLPEHATWSQRPNKLSHLLREAEAVD